MVRKRIRRILSGGAAIFIVLFCTLNANAQFGGEAITYTISGSTGVPDVTMVGLPGVGGQTVRTDQNGYYNATVKYGWTGTVKPDKKGFTFEPASKLYPRVTADTAGEDYMPTAITYTIAGKITGAESVQLVGLPGDPITGADGSYSVTVDYGWQGTVTPTKEGFSFTPSPKTYPPTLAHKTNENYKGEALKLLITGLAGESGVAMKGLPGNVVSAANGSFTTKVDYNWTGSVTPEKEGFEFEPASLPYNDIITNQTNQSFIATALTFILSGTTGTAGVEMKGLPNTFTDGNGYFSANVKWGFTGTITPTKAGLKFDPATWMLHKVNSDRTQTFTAETIKLTISGTTRLPGVEMNGLPDNPVTGSNGSYSVTVDYGWEGTVTPMKAGYKFAPESKTYPAVTRNTVDPAFRGAPITFTISGNVQRPGATIRVMPGGKAIVADPSGAYKATVAYDWTGTITPSMDGYEFMPTNLPFDNVMADQAGQDFQPTLLQRKISGVMRDDKGQPVANVTITANNNGGQTTTGAAGEYELSVGHGWTGTLTPLKEGYTFRPTNRMYPRVTANQLNHAYTAIVMMFNISGAVKLGGTPIDGVLMTASDGSGSPITGTTDLQGKYSFKLPYGWSGELVPTKPGIRFNPASVPLMNVTGTVVDGVQVTPKTTPPPSIIPPVATPSSIVPPGTPPPSIVPPGTPPPSIVPPGTPPPSIVSPGGTPPVAPSTALTPDQQKMKVMEDKIAALVLAQSRPRVAGPAPDPGTVLITDQWFDSDLVMDVLPAIANAAGIPIIPDDSVIGIVNLNPINMSVEDVLDMVLIGTPYVWKRLPNYYIVASAGPTDDKFPMIAVTRRVRLSYITAEAAVGLLHTTFKPYAQAEIAVTEVRGTATTVARTPQTYTVLVTAPPFLLERIVADLKLIDKMPDQVLLKARIVAMSRTDLLNLGVEWGWPTLQVGMFAGNNYGQGDQLNDFGGKSPWGISMGYTPDLTFTNSLQLALNLLTVNGEATILSQPSIMAQDGHVATMKVVNEEYYFLTAEQQGSFYSSSQLETIESGTTLTITPHIGENNDIMLHVSIEVSDSVAQGRETNLPIVTRRTSDNRVRVLDGGTVALAGLTQDKSVTTHKRTPGFSSIPLLGALFNNSNDITTTREVAVFITAHILRAESPQAAATTQPVRRNSSTPAELDFDRTPVGQGFDRTPVGQGFDRTPVGQGFDRTPVGQGFDRTPVAPRFDPAPRNDRFNPAPKDDRFNPAPRDDRYSPAPVVPRSSVPPRSPAPARPMGNDFKSQLGRSLSGNQRR